MKRLIGSVICAAALLLGSTASAAPVDIRVVQQSFGSSFFDVFFDLNITVGINGIQLFGQGAVGFTPVAGLPYAPTNSNISQTELNSAQGTQVLISGGPAAVATNPTPTVIGGTAGTLNILFGTFEAGTDPLNPFTAYGFSDIFEGDTLFDNQPIATQSPVEASVNTFYASPPVPEPTSILLIGAALAALGLVRRTA